MLHPNSFWEFEHWLELLPFTDRPAATIDAVKAVNAALPAPRRMERVVAALGNAPDDEAERTLVGLARQDLYLASRHEWANAMMARGTVSAALTVLDFLADGRLTATGDAVGIWGISDLFGPLVRCHPELKTELLRRYQFAGEGPSRRLIERVLAELGDTESLLALAQGYALGHRRFDGRLELAIRDVALQKHPAEGWVGSYELRPVPTTRLRKGLFAMLAGTPQEAAVAEACLVAIDKLRDEYGSAEFEPRHPDIESGRPWPLAARCQ
jgi:hypothetical protein